MKPATRRSPSTPRACEGKPSAPDHHTPWEALERSSPVGLFQTDAAGACVYVNARWCELTGLSAAEALGVGWAHALHPDDRERISGAWSRAAETASPFAAEYRLLHADGTVVWVYGQATPDVDVGGSGVAFVGSITDVTERHLAEERLRRSEAHLAALIEQSIAGIAETDLTGRFTLVNDRYCEITGYAREELLGGLRMQAITHPDDLPRNAELFQRLVQDGTPFVIEKRYIRQDGAIVWVGNSVSVVHDERGDPRSAMAVVIDITQRKQAEASLREREELLRLTMQAARAGAWAVDMATDCDEWSDEVFPLLGLAPGEVEPSYARLVAAVHPDDRARLIANADAAMAAGIEGQGEYRVVWPDGSVHWLLARGRTITDGGGQPRRVGLFIDITERKQAEAERRTLLDALAHELRNPLTTLKLQAQLLQRQVRRQGVPDRETLIAHFGESDALVTRMTTLIDTLDEQARVAPSIDPSDVGGRTSEVGRTDRRSSTDSR